jgi:RHS repeat-associated protein
LNVHQTDDFCYGWRLEFRDTDLRTSLDPDGQYERLGVRSQAFDDNTRLNQGADGGFYGLSGAGFNPADPLFGGVYILTTKEGIVYEIDGKSGDLLTVKDTNGNTLTFTDGGIFSETGVNVTFERDTQGRIVKIIDPENNELQYNYDAQGNLIQFIDPEEYDTEFIYDVEGRPHYLSDILDPLDRPAIETQYLPNGRLKKIIDVDGDPIEFEYDPANSTQIIKDAFGNPTAIEYDQRGNVVRQINAFGHETILKYDANNNQIETIDPNGSITQYNYNGNNDLLSRTALHDPDDLNPEVTRYTRNRFGQTTSITLPTGAVFSMDYDSRGNLLALIDNDGIIVQEYKYDSRGNLIEERDPFGATYYDDFDAFGNPRWNQNSLGQTTTSTYSADGQIETVTDENGTSKFFYDRRGREIRAEYSSGITVTYGHGFENDWTSIDSPTLGHIERRFTADGSLGGWLTADGGELIFTYNDNGQLETETTPDDQVTRYAYDKLGRVKQVTDESTGLVTLTHYDALPDGVLDPDPGIEDHLIGRVAARTVIVDDETQYTTSYTYYGDGQVKTTTDPNGHTWFYRHTLLTTTMIDPLGRETTSLRSPEYLPTETRHADGTTTTIDYRFNNNLLKGQDHPEVITDRGGNDRHYTYDSFGRLETATDLDDNIYTYHYGDDGLERVENPTGETVLSYTYDDLDNIETITYLDGGVERLTYNPVDNRLASVTLPSGVVIDGFEYSDAGQQTRRVSSLDGEVITTYEEGTGNVLTVEDATGTTSYHYDEVTGWFTGLDYGNGGSIRYGYNTLGQVEQVSVQASPEAAAYVTTYDYDGIGNLKTVTDPLGGETVMVYDEVNRLRERVLPNGVKTVYQYKENTDQVEKITHLAADGVTVLSSIEYIREGIGEPTRIIREDGSYVDLVYDDSLRLEQASYYDSTGSLEEEIVYTYDVAGNRRSVSIGVAAGTYRYDNTHQLEEIVTATGTESYTYDAGGRIETVTRDGETFTLSYNTDDLITKVTTGAGETVVEYRYDSQGRRIEATDTVGERDYITAPIMGGDLESPHLVTDDTNNLLAAYTYAGAMPLLRLDADGNPVYYLTDAMGSVIGLADGAGEAVARFAYDSFGNIRDSVGIEAANPEELGGDFRFQGQWLESQTDFYHFRARYYDPESGLFLSRDPVDIIEAEPESSNPYQFVYNNPHVYSDPTGQITITSIQSAQQINSILERTRSAAAKQAYEHFIDEAKGVVGDLLQSALGALMPNMWLSNTLDTIQTFHANQRDSVLEGFIRHQVCGFFGGRGGSNALFSHLWFTPEVDINGVPQSNGFNCSDPHGEFFNFDPNHPNLDFIFKKNGPETHDSAPKAWLIGDIKRTMRRLHADYVGGEHPRQWKAVYNYAEYSNGHQFTPLTFFIVWRPGTGTDQQIATMEAQVAQEGFEKHVIVSLLKFYG